MPKCRNCVHWEACREYVTGLAAARGVDLDATELEQIFDSDDCDHFHDSSRFVELPPCKEGDSVYSICFCYGEGDTITEWTVVDIFLLSSKEEGNSIGIRLKDECIFISISPCELGNRYFLTKEAAEQALKERESNAGRNDI